MSTDDAYDDIEGTEDLDDLDDLLATMTQDEINEDLDLALAANRRPDHEAALVQGFQDPMQPLTMGNVSRDEARLLNVILMQGRVTGSRVFVDFVENHMRLTRSIGAFGSEQAARVAVSRTQELRDRGFFQSLFGMRPTTPVGEGDE